MFFFRQYGAGIKNYQNIPIGLTMQIGIPYNIANSVAYRNTVVSDENPDRRIATSQSSIEFEADDEGDININVPYFLYSDYMNMNNISISTAGLR
jgi:hypothetical protein